MLALDAWAGHGWSPDPEIRGRDLSDPKLLGTHWLGAIRDFNRDAPPERQIRIFGIDVERCA